MPVRLVVGPSSLAAVTTVTTHHEQVHQALALSLTLEASKESIQSDDVMDEKPILAESEFIYDSDMSDIDL